LEHSYFCHCFGFRASDFDFLTEKTEVFGQALITFGNLKSQNEKLTGKGWTIPII